MFCIKDPERFFSPFSFCISSSSPSRHHFRATKHLSLNATSLILLKQAKCAFITSSQRNSLDHIHHVKSVSTVGCWGSRKKKEKIPLSQVSKYRRFRGLAMLLHNSQCLLEVVDTASLLICCSLTCPDLVCPSLLCIVIGLKKPLWVTTGPHLTSTQVRRARI